MQVALEDYAWAAGVATDLVNTTSEVWQDTGDRLAGVEDLHQLVFRHVQHSPGGEVPAHPELLASARTAAAPDLEAVHRLRARVRDLLDDPEPDRLVQGASALTAGIAELRLVPAAAGQLRWAAAAAPGATIEQLLALVSGVGILGVLRVLGADRFRQCAAPTCRGAFIDTTRPGSRRYCMPGLCGNRFNVANHRRRRSSSSGR